MKNSYMKKWLLEAVEAIGFAIVVAICLGIVVGAVGFVILWLNPL